MLSTLQINTNQSIYESCLAASFADIIQRSRSNQYMNEISCLL